MADMTRSAPRVLIVEDDPSTRELIRFHLTSAGYEIEESGEGAAAIARAQEQVFQLIVLDHRLPDVDGLVVCQAIRQKSANRETPILMVRGRATEADKVAGLESGADDYLVKPFGIRELLARIAAMIRRHDRLMPSCVAATQAGQGVAIDRAKRRVMVRGLGVEFTRQEFELLELLIGQPGVVFSRVALASYLTRADREITERTIDAIVRRIRMKLERDPRQPELLLTARSAGYKFSEGQS
jgi:DNA-binding response OmpR family regulator